MLATGSNDGVSRDKVRSYARARSGGFRGDATLLHAREFRPPLVGWARQRDLVSSSLRDRRTPFWMRLMSASLSIEFWALLKCPSFSGAHEWT